MALPNSGTITLAMIQAEFGGPTSPILLSNYYRGGTYVANSTANQNIATSGTLIFPSQFYGAQKFTTAQNIYSTAGSGTETIPTGATTCVIEVWGGTGGSSGGSGTGMGVNPGSGSGSGGYSRTSLSVTGGHTLNYTVGAAGAQGGIGGGAGGNGTSSTVSSGTQAITTMTGPYGDGAPASATPGSGGSVGTGGTQANTAGNTGISHGSGGAAVAGVHTTGTAGVPGRSPGGNTSPGLPGFAGVISFYYT